MKKILNLVGILIIINVYINGQSTNDVLNLLLDNKVITREQADSVRAEAAIKQMETDAKKKSFGVTSGKAIQLAGYTHLRLQVPEEKGKISGMDIRRAYFDIKGNLSPIWAYRLQTDFSGTPKIMDAQVDLKLKDFVNFTFGQHVIPFSLNNTTSNTKLELADRVQAVEAFSGRKGDVLGDNNGRDIGISAFGSFLKLNGVNLIEYRIGVYNGSGINKADLNDAKEVIGRLILHPLKGLDVGGSFYNGWTPDSATLNNKSKPEELGLRQRFGAEVNYTWNILNFKGEYLAAKDGKIDKAGYYIQAAAFVVKDKIQLVARYDTYDKNTDTDDNLNTNVTTGINIFFTKNILLQAAYTFRGEESNEFNNNIGALQLQASF